MSEGLESHLGPLAGAASIFSMVILIALCVKGSRRASKKTDDNEEVDNEAGLRPAPLRSLRFKGEPSPANSGSRAQDANTAAGIDPTLEKILQGLDLKGIQTNKPDDDEDADGDDTINAAPPLNNRKDSMGPLSSGDEMSPDAHSEIEEDGTAHLQPKPRAMTRKSIDNIGVEDDDIISATISTQKNPSRGAALALQLLANLREEKIDRERMQSMMQAHSNPPARATHLADANAPIRSSYLTETTLPAPGSPASIRKLAHVATPPDSPVARGSFRGMASSSPDSPISLGPRSTSTFNRGSSAPTVSTRLTYVEPSLFGIAADDMEPSERLLDAKKKLRSVRRMSAESQQVPEAAAFQRASTDVTRPS